MTVDIPLSMGKITKTEYKLVFALVEGKYHIYKLITDFEVEKIWHVIQDNLKY